MSKISRKSKKMIIAVAFALGSTAIGAGIINAQTPAKRDVRMNAFVDAIAEKFNLDSSEVETVIKEVMEQQRKTMREDREQEFADRLDKAVTEGKLTQKQADLIASKKDEVKYFIDDLQDMDEKERTEAVKNHMDSIKTWAADNNIPEPYMLFTGKGYGKKGGFMHDFDSELK